MENLSEWDCFLCFSWECDEFWQALNNADSEKIKADQLWNSAVQRFSAKVQHWFGIDLVAEQLRLFMEKFRKALIFRETSIQVQVQPDARP